MESSEEFAGTARFAIRRRLGAGGMGIVYEAYDRLRDTTVALKTLRNVDPQSLYRLKQEFRALQEFEHPNLVSLGELVEDGGVWFFTMELIPGTDLLSWVRPRASRMARGTEPLYTAKTLSDCFVDSAPPGGFPNTSADRSPQFDEALLRDALAQLADGLCALHLAGKVHRDIKPSNVLVTPEARLVLLDFGLIVDTEARDDSTDHHVVGTATYMAPEQAASKPVGPEADWYSVGCVLYEALTGTVPFQGAPLAVLMTKQHTTPPPPHELTPDLPADLDQLCTALLAFEPHDRPTGGQILRLLGRVSAPPIARQSHNSSVSGGAPFVGREHELEVLRTAFEATRNGDGVTVYVVGESGIGKTALIERFTGQLRYGDEPVATLRGRCYERESVPYKGLDGVVDALSRHLRRLPRTEASSLLPRNASLLPNLFPVLGGVEVFAEAPRPLIGVRDPRELRNRAFAALRELLTKLAERQPLVLLIDDLQWADADSVLLLSELTRPPDPPPMLLIATVRDGASADVLGAARGHVERIELAPLPRAHARALAAALLARRANDPGAAGPGDADAIVAETAGHPLFIDELVRHIAATGERSPTIKLDDAIVARVTRLEPGAARLLQFAAIAGAPLPQIAICQAAETTLADAARDLAVLRAASLVRAEGKSGAERIEAYHDRIREAVVATVPPDERRRMHGRLAVALEASGAARDQPEILVRHLEAAGRLHEATQRAEEAAERARNALAFDRGAELYETALRLGEHAPDARRQLLRQLGDALSNAGRGRRSAAAYLDAAEGADPALRLECQRQAAEQLLISGHLEQGFEALRAVLAEVGVALPSTPRRALASLVWHRARLRVRGLSWTPRHESEIPARDLTRLDVYKSVSHGLGIVDTIRGSDFQARGLLLALQLGERTRVARSLAEAAVYLACQGGRALARARPLLEPARQIAEGCGDPYLLGFTTTCEAAVLYFEGRFAPAIERARRAEIRLVEGTVGAIWEINSTRLCRLWILRRLGHYDEISRCFDAYVHDAVQRGDRHMETSVRWLCSDVWLARADLDAARADLETVAWVPPDDRFHIQHWYQTKAAAELELYTGEVRAAGARLAAVFPALRGALLDRVQDLRAEALWLHGRTALGSGDVELARERARRLDRERVGYASLWAELLRAGIAALEGDNDETMRRLREVETRGAELDMHLCAAVARRRYGARLGGSEGAHAVADADAWMKRHGVVDPERMADLVAPGLAKA